MKARSSTKLNQPESSRAIVVVAALIYRSDELMIVRRGPDMSGAGFWEFPGGKVEAGEDEVTALEREVWEELGLKIRVEERLGENLHAYPNKTIHLKFYWVPWPGQNAVLTEHDALLWVPPEKIDLQTLSEADRPIVPAIAANHRFSRRRP
jgi:mutator protein MutT